MRLPMLVMRLFEGTKALYGSGGNPRLNHRPDSGGATLTPPTSHAARLSERRFFTGMALAILAVVFVGFSRGFYLRAFFPGHPVPPEPFFAVHGIAFSAWIVLLVAQA